MIWKIVSDLAEESWVNNIPKNEWTGSSWEGILNFIYMVAGIVAVAFIIRGAVIYLTSQGQPDKIRQGSQALTYAIIGLAVVIVAAAATNFLFATIGDAG